MRRVLIKWLTQRRKQVLMDRRWWTMLLSVLLMMVGCQKQQDGNSKAGPMDTKVPEIMSESEEGGFVDLVFRIEDCKPLADGSQCIKAVGLHKGQAVGFEVVLGPTWKKGKLDKDVPFKTSSGTVSYHRIGPESDAFLQILDELYGTKLNPKAMAANTPFTGISLKGDPADLASGEVKIKLFYESGGEDRYAELYTNINLTAYKLEVREKDEGYRKMVVQALRGN
jgi:hypothetical protein